MISAINRKTLAIFSSCLLAVSLPGHATIQLDENTGISGFGSLMATYADSDSLGFRRDVTQYGLFDDVGLKTDSLFGVQFDHRFSPSLKATAQLVIKDRAVSNDFNSSLEWAYLTYQNSNDWVVRIGRVAINLTLTDEFGNVGYAYDWVRPPVEFYGSIPIYSIDGGDFTYRYSTEKGMASVKFFAGTSKRHYESSDFDMTPFVGAAFQLETNQLNYRASLSQTKLSHFYSARISRLESFYGVHPELTTQPEIQTVLDKLDINDGRVNYYTLGADYRFGDWRWLGEIAYLDSDVELFLPYITAYTGIVKRFSDYSLFSILSHGETTKGAYQTPVANYGASTLQSQVQDIFDWADVDQTTLSLGTRWDLQQNLALKLQWDSTWVAQNKAMLWERDTDTTPAQRVDIITLGLNFVF